MNEDTAIQTGAADPAAWPARPRDRQYGLRGTQAAVALRRLGYDGPGEAYAIVTHAAADGQHITARHLISYHPNEDCYDIIPAGYATRHATPDHASSAASWRDRWLAQIRDIASQPGITDAEAGGRIRALLFPAHVHEDDGTAEGCPGCFPPGEAIGSGAYAGGIITPVPAFGADLDWLFAVIPVVDQALDDMAPPEYRDNPLANKWRRFSAGPVSEAAETIDALNGMTGGNPRKGVTHTESDLLGEAADTAFSSLLAIQSQTKDIAQTWMIFIEAAAKAYSRVPDENRPEKS